MVLLVVVHTFMSPLRLETASHFPSGDQARLTNGDAPCTLSRASGRPGKVPVSVPLGRHKFTEPSKPSPAMILPSGDQATSAAAQWQDRVRVNCSLPAGVHRRTVLSLLAEASR